MYKYNIYNIICNIIYIILCKAVLSCFKNVKYILAMFPSNSTSNYLPNRNENKYPPKDFCVTVGSTFAHNSSKLKTTQILIYN